MSNNSHDFGGTPCFDFAIYTLKEIQTAGYKFPTPSLITDAVVPEF
jgi:hypothetical protein